MIQPGEINLPTEFQVALYENLVQELQKKGVFSQVYRDGDRNAAVAVDLVTLHTTVTGFKKGSELERDGPPSAGPPPSPFIVSSRIKMEMCCGNAISPEKCGSSATT